MFTVDKKQFRGFLLAVISAALFALQYPIISSALVRIDPFVGAFFECIFSLLLSGAVLLASKQANIFRVSSAVCFAGLLNCLGLLCLFASLSILHPSTVGLIGRLYFVFTMVISAFVFQEKFDRFDVLSLSLLSIGLVLVSTNEIVNETKAVTGVALAVLFPLLFALQNMLVSKESARYSPMEILFKTKLICLPLASIGLFFSAGKAITNMFASGAMIALATLVSTFFGLWFLYKAFAVASFKTVNLAKTSDPIFVFTFSYLMNPKPVSNFTLLGFAAIILALPIALILRNRYSSAAHTAIGVGQ